MTKNKNATAKTPDQNPQFKQSPFTQAFSQIPAQQPQIIQAYQGPVPLPAHLEGIERIVPGSAKQIVDASFKETEHRHFLEKAALDANISSQARQLTIAENQSKAVFRSDFIGQIFGLIASLSCIVGAVFLAIHGQQAVALALAALPLAAVAKAFFAPRIQSVPPKQ